MMRKALFIFPVIFLYACGSSGEDNGGPCNYDIDTIGATITRMDSTGTPYPDILLSVSSKINGTDTLRYTNSTNESPTWEMAAERGYRIGAELKCVRKYRTSGHCDPEIFVVQKEVMR